MYFDYYIHFPEETCNKAIVLCARKLLDIISSKISLLQEIWFIESDDKKTALCYKINMTNIQTWYQETINNIHNAIFVACISHYRINESKNGSETIRLSIALQESQRGLTVPKIDGEKTLRIVFTDSMKTIAFSDDLMGEINSICIQHKASANRVDYDNNDD